MEYGICTDDIAGSRESPPLARGIYRVVNQVKADGGITPAHTGNIPFVIGDYADIENHPRSHGEYLGMEDAQALRVESPPLTRGIFRAGP